MQNQFKKDWNPDKYLKFKNERTQPSIDLVSRIRIESPKNIIDIGCGPGNSTQILLARWPKSNILGIDNSPAMIKAAKESYPDQSWGLMDAMDLKLERKYDLVFSNATIQWLPDHESLLKQFFYYVNIGGALAIQLPSYLNMPVHKVVSKIAAKDHWKKQTEGCFEHFYVYPANFYHNILSQLSDKVELWETSYIHIMDSHRSIIDMVRTTGMKPFLDRLNGPEKEEFEREVLEKLKLVYPKQENGKVLFPFDRIFFIAYHQ